LEHLVNQVHQGVLALLELLDHLVNQDQVEQLGKRVRTVKKVLPDPLE
jgi:Trp operon repressor